MAYVTANASMQLSQKLMLKEGLLSENLLSSRSLVMTMQACISRHVISKLHRESVSYQKFRIG